MAKATTSRFRTGTEDTDAAQLLAHLEANRIAMRRLFEGFAAETPPVFTNN
jgi:hypothetical protein